MTPATRDNWHHSSAPRKAGDPIIVRNNEGWIVCEVPDGPDAEAIVRLIEAAPAMLAVCREVLDLEEDVFVAKKLRRIIASATTPEPAQ